MWVTIINCGILIQRKTDIDKDKLNCLLTIINGFSSMINMYQISKNNSASAMSSPQTLDIKVHNSFNNDIYLAFATK